MTDKLKCPFCGSELENACAQVIYFCPNDECDKAKDWYASKQVWQALIQAKQDLEIAKSYVKGISEMVINSGDNIYIVIGHFKKLAEQTLEQIEHKGQTMTQRIFDVDNPQDVKDLFDIIPDRYIRITRTDPGHLRVCSTDCAVDFTAPIVINWRNKTEITRPVDETQWIGKLCWFWGTDMTKDKEIGILQKIEKYSNNQKLYRSSENGLWCNCRPVRRDEVQFVEDAETKEALKVATDALYKIENFDCHSKGAIEIIAGMTSIANGALYKITSITNRKE